MKLFVGIYKQGKADCTNGGESANYDNAFIVTTPEEAARERDKPLADSPGATHYLPVYEVIYRAQWKDYIAVPLNYPTGKAGPMFGGNFVYTSDSRFPVRHPIPIHDRFESYE